MFRRVNKLKYALVLRLTWFRMNKKETRILTDEFLLSTTSETITCRCDDFNVGHRDIDDVE